VPDASSPPDALLAQSLASGRIHSAYLLSGPGETPVTAALRFVRGLVCNGKGDRPCEACPSCRRSGAPNDVVIDGAGKRGPLFRYVGEHPDLVWVARGPDDTRVRIGQIRALQTQLRLRATESERRAAVIEGAEWLNVEAQNALLRLLEEPPPATTLVLVAGTAAGLLATLRSRCQRIAFPVAGAGAWLEEDAPESVRDLAARLDGIGRLGIPELLDWAEEYRGARADAAAAAEELLETATAWLHREASRRARAGERDLRRTLDAFASVRAARRGLVQRNANPQMTAERVLLAVREAAGS
jgi:DNA polymerase III delta prime subunit